VHSPSSRCRFGGISPAVGVPDTSTLRVMQAAAAAAQPALPPLMLVPLVDTRAPHTKSHKRNVGELEPAAAAASGRERKKPKR
jgi:hypothetical protein